MGRMVEGAIVDWYISGYSRMLHLKNSKGKSKCGKYTLDYPYEEGNREELIFGVPEKCATCSKRAYKPTPVRELGIGYNFMIEQLIDSYSGNYVRVDYRFPVKSSADAIVRLAEANNLEYSTECLVNKKYDLLTGATELVQYKQYRVSTTIRIGYSGGNIIKELNTLGFPTGMFGVY